MPHTVAIILLSIAGIYGLIGCVVGAWFVFHAIARVDHAALNAQIGFRFIIWPGAAALWPWVALRLMAAMRKRDGAAP